MGIAPFGFDSRRRGVAALTAPLISEQEPRTEIQEPLLWNCNALPLSGQYCEYNVQLLLVVQFDL